MKMHRATLLVLLGSLFAMGFALYAQYIGGYHPCELCMWQRYGYVMAIVLCLTPNLRALVPLALAFVVVVAVYHTGIEHKWWHGFQTCSAGFSGGQSLEDLRNKIMAAPSVRCDEATWFFLGLSMAAWNAIYAFFLFVISLLPLWQVKSI
jgi:disulfide bond formation protein DsbB